MDMKALWKMVALLAVLLGAGLMSGCDGTAKEVHAANDQYDAAIRGRDGTRVVELTSRESIARMGKVLEHAKTASKQQLQQMTAVERYYVLMARHVLKGSVKNKIEGREFLRQLAAGGWLGSSTGWERVRVTVDRTKSNATVMYRAKGRTGHQIAYWVREDGVWKLDMDTEMQTDDGRAALDARDAGLAVDEYLVRMLEVIGSEKVSPSVWEPPK
jgi:hypothetical protein